MPGTKTKMTMTTLKDRREIGSPLSQTQVSEQKMKSRRAKLLRIQKAKQKMKTTGLMKFALSWLSSSKPE